MGKSKGSKIAIEGINLKKSFNGNVAVNDVTLKVYEGEFVSLLGPSGCGKTTLLRMLSGLEFPNNGTILLGGKDVTNIPAYSRDSNLVFQQLALFPHLNVWQNIAYGLRVRGEKKKVINEKVKKMLSLVRLEQYSQRNVQELSGGQAQRVAIARALVNNPKVLFLDEPLSALDQKLRNNMQEELKRIQRESNSTFIFVTHDQNEAMAISDRIGVMNNGELLQFGTTKEIYEEPSNEFVATFIGETNLVNVNVAEIKKDKVVITYNDTQILSRINSISKIQEGQQRKLSIREEYISINQDIIEYDNTLEATIEEVRYGGTKTFYKLRLSNGDCLNSVITTLPGEKSYIVGEKVSVHWNWKDSLLLDS